VSEGAVRKRAKAQGWVRESVNSVRNQVRTGAEEPSAFGMPGNAEQSHPNHEDHSEASERDLSEAPEWMRLYYGAADAAPIRLIAHTDRAFPDAFKIYKGGVLLAIGREPQSAAASRLLEERLATPQSKVELVFVDANVSVFFTVGDVVG
jgi:hypothetical protein